MLVIPRAIRPERFLAAFRNLRKRRAKPAALSLGGRYHRRDFIKQMQAAFLQFFGMFIRHWLDLGLAPVDLPVHLVIAVRQRAEMGIIKLEAVQRFAVLGEFGVQIMRGV